MEQLQSLGEVVRIVTSSEAHSDSDSTSITNEIG
jgi:hypothetical protein